MHESQTRERFPLQAGSVYSINGAIDNAAFNATAYCTRVGNGTVDLIGRTSHGKVLHIKNHPIDSVFTLPSNGFSLGARVDGSFIERGSAVYGHHKAYISLLEKRSSR